jgi:ABC-type sugar transport system ATPase subunit
VVLDRGEISQVGTPLELYNMPANRFVASFIGSPAMNFVDVQVSGTNAKVATVALPGGTSATVETRTGKMESGATTLGIRPEHLRIVDNGAAALKGTVNIVEQLGNSTILYVDTPAGPLVVEGDGALVASSGDNIGLTIESQHAHLFGASGRAV